MEKTNRDKERQLPQKPEWQIILDHLVYQDQEMVYRICRKMIIHLNRLGIPEIKNFMDELNPAQTTQKEIQNYGQNWPKPKGSPFIASLIIDELFEIADKYLPDSEITTLMTNWIHQEQVGFLSLALDRRHSPLTEIVEAVKKYLQISHKRYLQTLEERIGLRVSMIYRFLSENLNYINIAKHYLTLIEFGKVLERVIGPANGTGKLGGKSAGLILARQILIDKSKNNPLLSNVTTPRSRFLTSDGLFEFLHYNALEEFVFTKYHSSDRVQQEFTFLEYIFKNSPFPSEAIYAFNMILDQMEGKPIIVRSSSILEDSFEGAFSGKYKSLFISNLGTKEERLTTLLNAIAEVYASTFGPDPIEYRRERNLLDVREEMGILIQQVVGNKVGKYYLPSFAGVAFSHNEMRWSRRIKRSDGVLRLVAGLGTRAVDRTIDDYPTLVCPAQPDIRINLSTEDSIRYSQQYVDVINLDTNSFETIRFVDLIKECNGNIPAIEKIVSFNRQGTLVDPVSAFADFMKEDLIVTFNPLLTKTNFIKQINEILSLLSEAYHGPVDIEFAHDGKELYLLQCRPQSRGEEKSVKIPGNIAEKNKIFTANHYVSNGLVKDIQYIVYVDSDGYTNLNSADEMQKVGKIISQLNRILPRRKFILIGPGRWGSKGDIKLGVPVIYSDINNTSMLIEVAKEKAGYVPELSFGTHFFQDLVEAGIKYLPLYPGKPDIIWNEDFFLNSHNVLCELITECEKFIKVVKVIKVDSIKPNTTVSVYMDGESDQAVAFISGN